MFFDYYWFMFFIPGLLLGLYAQMKLSSTYSRYSQVGVESGISGAQAAREILDGSGLTNVSVHEVPGHLTDHYDPRKKALFLSGDNYHGHSVAAVGVAAHEAGHALQHQAAYAPLQLRMALAPITSFASNAVMGIALLGIVMNFAKLLWIAVAAFAVITLFQMITLPVEFDASRRAKVQLMRLGLIRGREEAAVGTVLSAAAMTYVAAMVQSILSLLYWVSLARGSNRD
jgi:uncharacterized protein